MMKTYIKQNGNPILELASPIRKVALWHVTKRCNMECKYCYGTFGGFSYKRNILEKDFDLDKMTRLIEFLRNSGIDRIHLCGGEPFLHNNFYEILRAIHETGMESFVLSNLTFLPNYAENLFSENIISNLSFSLDSLDRNYNYYVRGAHEAVIDNFRKILQYKEKYNSNIELGLYVVATKKNLDYLYELIDWAVEKGINYITLQAVYLPKKHRYYNELSLTQEDLNKLKHVFEYLTSYGDRIRISGSLLKFITDILISKEKLNVENCFVEQDSQYYFIDGDGNIKTCTTKENIICNITDLKLPFCIKKTAASKVCSDFCLDCIGIWEMMYPEEVNEIITRL